MPRTVLKTGIKTFYVNERPNLEVDGFPVIDEVYTLRGLEEFVNQSYAANPVGNAMLVLCVYGNVVEGRWRRGWDFQRTS